MEVVPDSIVSMAPKPSMSKSPSTDKPLLKRFFRRTSRPRKRETADVASVSTAKSSLEPMETLEESISGHATTQYYNCHHSNDTLPLDLCEEKETLGIIKYRTQSYSLGKEFRVNSNKSVSFSTVNVNFHGITLGDNPSTSSGPPISIEWKPFDSHTIALAQYEFTKPDVRSKEQMIVPRWVREDWLRHAGYSRSELRLIAREVQEIQRHRSKSSNDGQWKERLRHWLRSCRRTNHNLDLDEVRHIKVS